MGYHEYFNQLLAPMRLYDLKSGLGATELKVVGDYMDKLFDELRHTEREMTVMTAEDEGLSLYSGLLPYYPVSNSTEDLRRALQALLSISGCSFTLEALSATLIGCGIDAIISESETPMTVEIRFPGVRGEPERFSELRERIEMILPCHLAIYFVLEKLIWNDLELRLLSWAMLEAIIPNWFELERLDKTLVG